MLCKTDKFGKNRLLLVRKRNSIEAIDKLFQDHLEFSRKALGIEFGVDPALSPLQLARRRSIIVLNGTGEQLPVRTQSIGTVFLFFTLCFLTDPAAVFRELFRVLKPGGNVMVGFIPAKSKWGKYLAQKGRENHPYYRHARFRTGAETKSILTGQNFQVIEAWKF